jgi:hypothetical protein
MQKFPIQVMSMELEHFWSTKIKAIRQSHKYIKYYTHIQ